MERLSSSEQSPGESHGATQYKELISRHQDLQQNKDKVEGTLISILLLTQITELKMLVDIGRSSHRLYDVVLALLVASVGALVLVGLIVLYVGNLRFYRKRHKAATSSINHCCRAGNQDGRPRCSLCCLRRQRRSTPAVRASRASRLTDSYVCVPLGVTNNGTTVAEPVPGRSADNAGLTGAEMSAENAVGESTASLTAVGCCPVGGDEFEPAIDGRHPAETSDNPAELDAAVDEARAQLAAITTRLSVLRADHDTRASSINDSRSWTMELNTSSSIPDEDISDTSCSSFDQVVLPGGVQEAGTSRKQGYRRAPDTRGTAAPFADRYEDNGVDDDAALDACRRQKAAIEAELSALEVRRQRVATGRRAVDEIEERAVFRAVMFWQQFTMYVLYFVCLMNIFITAFGIYSSSSYGGASGSGTSSSTLDIQPTPP